MYIIAKGLMVILFGTMYIITFIYLPLINSVVFAYEKEGVKINFGIARGTDSTIYALLALISGSMARKSGTKIVPLAGMIIAICLIVIIREKKILLVLK